MKASLSVEDQERVDKLRQLVQQNLTDYYDTDFNLLRWLQGYEGATLEEVAAKLNNHLKARRSLWNLDEFLKQPRNHPVHYHWMYGITGQSGVVDNGIVNFEPVSGSYFSSNGRSFLFCFR
ncbi:unnamed protein product [Anisakis simplex]|uniref:SMI1/KNR4 family protein n=1 Tax=Anisakis simplex TaxID=6269 RepID=A0A0M3JF90_ANISI|nr:unnamed protein product [Anisakis simplex]